MNNTAIKTELTRKRWSYRKAAKVLGISHTHLSRVANGNRKSRALALKILTLPNAPVKDVLIKKELTRKAWNYPKGLTDIKRELSRKGWSYREAAKVLGVDHTLLCRVANGDRGSHRFALKIQNLPNYSEFVSKLPTHENEE